MWLYQVAGGPQKHRSVVPGDTAGAFCCFVVVWGASCPIYVPDCAYSCLVFHGSATFRMYTRCALIHTYTQPHTLEIAFFLYVAAYNARKGPPYLGRICLSPPLLLVLLLILCYTYRNSRTQPACNADNELPITAITIRLRI